MVKSGEDLGFSHDRAVWKSVGPGPQSLVTSPNTITQYLGLGTRAATKPGNIVKFLPDAELTKFLCLGLCITDKRPARRFSETLSGQWQHDTHSSLGLDGRQLFKTNREVYLMNGDRCSVNDYAVVQDPQNPARTFIGQVKEILQQGGSIADTTERPDGILIQKASVTRQALPYSMPYIDLNNEFVFVTLKVSVEVYFMHHLTNCIRASCARSTLSMIVLRTNVQPRGHSTFIKSVLKQTRPEQLLGFLYLCPAALSCRHFASVGAHLPQRCTA